MPHSLEVHTFMGITGGTYSDDLSYFRLFDPSEWEEKFPPCVMRAIFMGGNPGAYVVYVELQYLNKQYVWFHQMKKHDESATYMRDDFWTWLVLKSLLVTYENKDLATKVLGHFTEETNFKEPVHTERKYLRNETIYPKLTSMRVIMYALFVDKTEWTYIPEPDHVEEECSGKHEEYGHTKTVKIGNNSEKTVYYEPGNHLNAIFSSYFYKIRKCFGKYL